MLEVAGKAVAKAKPWQTLTSDKETRQKTRVTSTNRMAKR
jgi:hypothetical protein